LTAAFILAGSLVLAATAHDLMPAPQRLEWRTGQLVVGPGFTIASAGVQDPRIDAAIARARARLRLPSGAGGSQPTLVVTAAAVGRPVQELGEDESYELTVTPRQARIDAPNPLGVLRGLETLLQLVREDGGRTVIPAVAVTDRPRFPWRGLLLDPCRRWEPLEVVKRTLDGMAAVKLNVFHWHLSEDQGFRIESKVFPRLHEQGSDGLYYMQPQVREVIGYARDRGIRVVPEFDMPGHSTSWLVGHPELGSAPGPFALVRQWGIFDNDLDPSREEVYAFLDRFIGEMAALFPDAYFHIGGDEVTPRQWNANPAIVAFMYRHELNDASDLQAYFNRRVNEILTRHRKRMVGWDEVLRPELPKSIVVQSWRGAKSLAEAARLGYDGILSDGYYLDLMFSSAFHYLNDPLPADTPLAPEARAHVLGGEACMWGEFVDPHTIDSRIWPRAAAIAERLWSPAELRDVADMYRRLDIQSVRLDALGLTHRTGYVPMLQRLAPGAAEPLRVLADVVEPVKRYRRGEMLLYTSATPLDRLVDAARPESRTAQEFRAAADRFLITPPASRDDAALRASLTVWRGNHASLDLALAASSKAAEARSLSRDLSAVAGVGLEALDAIRSGRAAPESWREQARRLLDQAQKPRAELELVVVPAIRKLVLAAGQIDAQATMSLTEWNRRLDEQVSAAAVRPEH
jgi:hexosaminidase